VDLVDPLPIKAKTMMAILLRQRRLLESDHREGRSR
jgi:hypothetical protein